MSYAIENLTTSTINSHEVVKLLNRPDVAYPGAKSPGASVTLTIGPLMSVPANAPGAAPVGALPPTYTVQLTPSAPVLLSVADKTVQGFCITISPLSADDTLAEGTLDIVVLA